MTTAGDWLFKPLFLLVYAGIGLLLLGLASRRRTDPALPAKRPVGTWLLGGLLGSAVIAVITAFALSGSHLLLTATIIGAVLAAVPAICAFVPRTTILPRAAALVLGLSLVWWQIAAAPLAILPLTAFAIVLAVLASALSLPSHGDGRPIGIAAVFTILGLLLLVDLGPYRTGDPLLFFLAHHWGAYIGPALDIKAGLVPFRDFPLQYGLGPTLVIAALCRGSDCWPGMELFAIATTLVNALLLLRMARTTAERRGPLWHGAVAIVVFASVFLWTGYPADGNLVLAFPSVGGARFLPTDIVACLLFFGRPNLAAAFVVPAVLWSPESAAMSIAVFGLCETARSGFIAACWRSASLLGGSYAALVLVHRAIFGVWLDPGALVEYVLHVPGPLPVDPLSDCLLLLAVLGLGAWLIADKANSPRAATRDRVVTALLFAAASYYLGRSHPNNICNLAPFLVLVALRAIDRPAETHRSVGSAAAFGLAVSVAALAFSPWRSAPFDPHPVVTIGTVTAQFTSLEPDIERIRARLPNPQELGIADFGPSYTRHQSEHIVWTPMDPSSLWSFVPSERRQLYITRAAAHLRRSGWAIFTEEQLFLFEDLQAGYTIAQQRRFDAPSPDGGTTHFLAACFDPRPELAPEMIGARCPQTGL